GRAALADPESLAFDAAGNLLVGEADADRVRRIRPDGTIEPFAGDGRDGLAPDGTRAATVPLRVAGSPVAIVVGADGTVYLAEADTPCVRTIDHAATLGTIGPPCTPP